MRSALRTPHFALAALLFACAAQSADWPTHRGNPERTGCLDGQPGPKAGKVHWVFKAQQHFIASPVPLGKTLLVSGLGAFNTGVFHVLHTDADAPQRIVWSKSAPFLKLPMVCSPAVVEGLIVFGDGMHQTDGAILYALKADTGRPLWQLPLPGKLVHLEGAPTVHNGRVYAGGGEAGILCVDLKRVTLDGNEQDLTAIEKLIAQRWAELTARYEEEKKKDPQFAIPPSEDALPKPAPKLLWRQGEGKWHVDAPVAVAGDRVLAGSAYIEEDKVGKCALVCLNANDGSLLWETPLKINPWAGPTVIGNLVLVGCSSIRFDKKLIPKAQGEVLALDLGNGQIKWRKDLPGGVLSAIAVQGDLAVFTCTDGRVRAWNVQTGEQKWEFLAPNPFFAGPALAGETVYVADLKCVLYAVGLADGKVQWTLDVAADPAVQAPGMVFGSPLVHGGDLYLATCNLEGTSAADVPCAVVCVSDKAGAAQKPVATFHVDKKRRRIEIPAHIAPRKLPNLQEIYPLEVVATFPAPHGQKAHETVVTFEVKPSDIHKALEQLGLKPGSPARGDESPATGPEVNIFLAVPGFIEGKPRLLPMERTMVDRRTGKTLPPLKWHFTGSVMRQPDPDKPLKTYGADLGGTLITLFPVTDETVFQTNLTMKDSTLLRMETNKYVLPDEGAPVTLIIEAK
ncbi:MAG TPA: PQQ-binding-like beta-propeller repeat protein [Planctomycetota bacterium]|nr:PQQ-binding-like beta-propeller repeat protein [Planctomycetota bacterium]HRR79234.1 PQQ-binding-like beta-propeller repeat protein [Planctomycetota bacterium]HRT94277.1 PQQ-binding-like beta-propeller repeat protein [Planctomycetota bacterium]